jgi:integrase
MMTQGKAEATLAEILEPINKKAGERPDPVYTFGHFVEGVYLPVWREKWKASTRMTEENRLQVHLVKLLDTRPIESITREELQSLLGRKAKHLSQSGVDHLRFRLRSVFELAMSEGLVSKNPATTLYTPKRCRPSRERRVLSQAQAVIMENVLDLRERLFVRLATSEGMRPGEILGLQVGDCDDEAISVRRRFYKGDVDTPKTKRSIREVALSNGTKALLKIWIDKLQKRSPESWLFPAEDSGSPMRRDNIWYRNIRPKLEKVGLQWATFQVMRRTFATLSKRLGIDAHTRSAQMGNTVDVNENDYVVSSLEDRLAAVRKLESTVIN